MPKCPGHYGQVWCLKCYLGAKGKASFPGHRGYRRPSPSMEETAMAFQLRKPVKGAKEGPSLSLNAGEFGQEYPALWAHLTSSVWPDGSPRQTSSFLVFSELGRMKCMLGDKEAGAVCFVTADAWEGLLQTLEKQLQEGTCDWRPDRSKPRGVR